MSLGGSRFGFLGGSCAIIVEGRRGLGRVIANLNLVSMACSESSTTLSRKKEYVLIFFEIGSEVVRVHLVPCHWSWRKLKG